MRILNVSASELDVVATCKKHDVQITAIESLMAGGTRFVVASVDQPSTMHNTFSSRLLTDDVRRHPTRLQRH